MLSELIYDVVIMNENLPEQLDKSEDQLDQKNIVNQQHIQFQNIYPKPFRTIYDAIEHQISYQSKTHITPNRSTEIEKLVLQTLGAVPNKPTNETICKLISRLLSANILFLDGTSILYNDVVAEFPDMGEIATHPQIIISIGISQDKIQKYTSIIPNPSKLKEHNHILLLDSSNNKLYENIETDDGNEQLLLGVWDEHDATIMSIDNSQSSTSDSRSVIIDELLFSKMKWIDGNDYYFYKNTIVGQY
jgi:hypothetical protein